MLLIPQLEPARVIPSVACEAAVDATTFINTSAVVGPERIGSSTLLYMRLAPAPLPDARLTITLDRIFVSTDRTWRGSIYVP
jgi:hypothetical protein